MVAPALPALAAHYEITSETIVAMTLSIFLVTFAIGPLFLAPLSEIYGRTWVGVHDIQATSRCILSYFFATDTAYQQYPLPGIQFGVCFCA